MASQRLILAVGGRERGTISKVKRLFRERQRERDKWHEFERDMRYPLLRLSQSIIVEWAQKVAIYREIREHARQDSNLRPSVP